MVFPEAHYVSLEDPAQRALALQDARSFLGQFGKDRVILDEVQRAPELFSYIQGIVDENDIPGQYILTGSQNFLLLDKINQSLAGRCGIHFLLPFSRSELLGTDPVDLDRLENLAGNMRNRTPPPGLSLFDMLWTGGYPRIHDKHIPPQQWLSSYVQTYVERDVRTIVNVSDLETFTRFLRLCAGRTGQILNQQSLGEDCGVDSKTVSRWLSILETSFIIKLLRPYYRNFSKRLIKSPKLYFLDSGLLCYLLGIQTPEQLLLHPLHGAVFESWVISELYKSCYHTGRQPNLYFYRDSQKREIDLIVDRPQTPLPVEIKSGQTVSTDFFRSLEYWRQLVDAPEAPAVLVYGGQEATRYKNITVLPWEAF